MSLKNMRDVARKFPQIQNSGLFHIRLKTSDNYIKNLMKECKLHFGNLIETKTEKVRRLKLEKKGKIPLQKNSKLDSEIPWILKNQKSLKRKTKIITFKGSSNMYMKEGEWIDWSTLELGHNPIKLNIPVKVNNLSTVKTVYKENNKEIKNTKNVENKIKTLDENIEDIISVPLFVNTKKNTLLSKQSNDVMHLSLSQNKYCINFPSVTKILTTTMSEEAKKLLDRWERQMIEKLGIEGFKLYRQELLQNGKYLHSAIESSLLQKVFDIHENVKLAFKSVSTVLKDVTGVKAIESHVVHPKLHYQGYIDCIAFYRGDLCLIDWKKSDKPKDSLTSTYDAPLQVASYIGALNADKNYPFKIKRGLIVIAYTSGEKANVHEINGKLLQLYWENWLQRLKKYNEQTILDKK